MSCPAVCRSLTTHKRTMNTFAICQDILPLQPGLYSFFPYSPMPLTLAPAAAEGQVPGNGLGQAKRREKNKSGPRVSKQQPIQASLTPVWVWKEWEFNPTIMFRDWASEKWLGLDKVIRVQPMNASCYFIWRWRKTRRYKNTHIPCLLTWDALHYSGSVSKKAIIRRGF